MHHPSRGKPQDIFLLARRPASTLRSALLCLLTAAWLCAGLARGQQPAPDWRAEVRRAAAAQDWTAALRIVEREITRAPQDMDVRAWRARVLAGAGRLPEAEREYREILAASSNDPDNWLGLGSVLMREGRATEALRSFDRAVALAPRRADLHAARGRALRAGGNARAAKREFQKALELEPGNGEAHAGLLFVRSEPRHELHVAMNTDLLSFADARHDEGTSLISRWTPNWSTNVGGNFYQRAGVNAGKFVASVSASRAHWGALTLGGAAAHDNDIIPKSEAFFDYDRGWNLREQGALRGIEVTYGQHWYWFTTARILTLNSTAIFYLPREWTWTLGVIAARSHFSGTGVEWRPSGVAKLGFPLRMRGDRQLTGNLFFAVGTENFAKVDQIGSFSSQTYGGGLRFQFTARQYLSGFAAYQRRTQDRQQTSLGFEYGVRF